jgi:hypothetical protein
MLLCSTGLQREADKDTIAVVQASYLYNIAKLVEWEDQNYRKGNFVIGVLGNSNVYQELVKKYQAKSIGNQPIEIQRLLQPSDAERCNILFVGRDKLDLVSGVYQLMEGKSTLVVTEYADALEDGSVINFMAVNSTLVYELSLTNAKKHGLKVGSTLKQLAERVEGP